MAHCNLLMGDCYMHLFFDQRQLAEISFRKAYNLFASEDNKEGMGLAKLCLGDIYIRLEAFEDARLEYIESRKISKRLGDKIGEGRALVGIGQALNHLCRFPEGLDILKEALHLGEKSGEINTIGFASMGAGFSCIHLGRYIEGAIFLNKGLTAFKKSGNVCHVANCKIGLAKISNAKGDATRARELFKEAIDLHRSQRNESGVALAKHISGGKAELVEALDMHRRLNDRHATVYDMMDLSTIEASEGNLVEAERLMREIIEDFSDILAEKLDSAKAILGMILIDKGDRSEGLEMLNEIVKSSGCRDLVYSVKSVLRDLDRSKIVLFNLATDFLISEAA